MVRISRYRNPPYFVSAGVLQNLNYKINGGSIAGAPDPPSPERREVTTKSDVNSIIIRIVFSVIMIRGNARIVAESYDMNSSNGAYGVFSVERQTKRLESAKGLSSGESCCDYGRGISLSAQAIKEKM
jgi:hypothetical protein